MTADDDRFEEFLRQFRPRRPSGVWRPGSSHSAGVFAGQDRSAREVPVRGDGAASDPRPAVDDRSPRAARRLPVAGAPRRLRWAAACAAGVALAVAAWLTLGRVAPVVPVQDPDPTAQAAREDGSARAALIADWNVDALDRMLTEMSPRVLPDVERPESSLHPLASQ